MEIRTSHPQSTATVQHIPNEIWLLIIAHSTLRDSWLSLRGVNQQLRACVDLSVEEALLPVMSVKLSFGLPCYDARNPLQGSAMFRPRVQRAESTWTPRTEDGVLQSEPHPRVERVRLLFDSIEPNYYRSQFMVRWDRLKDAGLSEKLDWEVLHGTTSKPCKLREPKAETVDYKSGVRDIVLCFDWRWTLGNYLRQT